MDINSMITLWHKSMTPERWKAYSMDRQILMVASEFSRAQNLIGIASLKALRECYERAMELLDLCTYDEKWMSRRRELLRFREAMGELYLADSPSREMNLLFYKTLMEWHPVTARIPLAASRS
jgi:hypothetical protein